MTTYYDAAEEARIACMSDEALDEERRDAIEWDRACHCAYCAVTIDPMGQYPVCPDCLIPYTEEMTAGASISESYPDGTVYFYDATTGDRIGVNHGDEDFDFVPF